MNRFTNLINRSSILFVIILSLWADPGVSVNLPPDWYMVEDRPEEFHSSSGVDDDDLEEAVDELMAAQGDSYDRMIEQSLVKTDKLVRWRLSQIKSDFGITSGGNLGLLSLKGRVAVENQWYPINSAKTDMNEDIVDSVEPNMLKFNALMSENDIRARIRKIADAAFYAGRVQDPLRMEMEMFQAVDKVSQMMQIPQDTSWYRWTPEKFRFQLSVSAEGKVLPFLSVGGDFRVRIEWKLHSSVNQKNSVDHASSDTETLRSFRELVHVLASDLQVVSQEYRGFQSDSVEISLGITAQGKIGIAKVSSGVVGTLFFKVNPFFEHQTLTDEQGFKGETLFLISDRIDTKGQGVVIGPSVLPGTRGPEIDPAFVISSGTVYEIDREMFRRGLKKAHEISGFFVSRAVKNKQKYWILKKFKTSFEMSAGGSLSIASLTGNIGVAVVYARKS